MHSREQRCYRQSCEVSHNVWFRMGLYQYSIYTELNVLMWHATYSQHPVTVYIIWALLSRLTALWSLCWGVLVLRIIDSAIVIIIVSYSSILSSLYHYLLYYHCYHAYDYLYRHNSYHYFPLMSIICYYLSLFGHRYCYYNYLYLTCLK